MFRELMPLLTERTVMLTLCRVNDSTIRVCVIPKRIKEDRTEEIGENALCSPLAVTGTVDELDRDFASQLSQYAHLIVKLGSNLAAIEAEHEAAAKAVKDEKKKDLDRQRGKSSGSKSGTGAESKPGPVIKDGKPVFGSKDVQAADKAPTLFDAPEIDVKPESTVASTPSQEEDVEPSSDGGFGSATAATASQNTPDQGQAAFSYPD